MTASLKQKTDEFCRYLRQLSVMLGLMMAREASDSTSFCQEILHALRCRVISTRQTATVLSSKDDVIFISRPSFRSVLNADAGRIEKWVLGFMKVSGMSSLLFIIFLTQFSSESGCNAHIDPTVALVT